MSPASWAAALPPARHPLWRRLGWVLVAGTLGLTFSFLLNRRDPAPGRIMGGDPLFGEGSQGRVGTLTEQLGPNRMVLSYRTIEGSEDDLRLKEVTGRLDEQAGEWRMRAPSARREAGVWTLLGPLELQVVQPGTGQPRGSGQVATEGPAIRWTGGAWEGLAPLRWDALEGAAQGQWHLPEGWRREPDGQLKVSHGPVVWQAPTSAGAPSALRSMEADRLWATPGFETGRLEGVRARMVDGALQASVAELSGDQVTWPGPLAFERSDGWRGEARSGRAPRPAPGGGLREVELKGFQAHRSLPEGQEQIRTEGARWTPAGLRLEGEVVWQQPVEGQNLVLRAPRVLLREGPGADLPESLKVGQAAAEGQPVLTWGSRTLSAPRMVVERATRRWRLQAPVLGRGEDGTFTGGAGQGDAHAWTIEGPIQVNLFSGGSLRGARLVWEDTLWTLTGRPATWSRLRERLSGPRILRRADRVTFPEGLSGNLAAADGDLSLRAEQGTSEPRKITLSGGVDCQGQGWRLAAESVVILLGADRVVTQVQARGGVSLQGRLGSGQGESLDLDPGAQAARWAGRVRGKGSGSAW